MAVAFKIDAKLDIVEKSDKKTKWAVQSDLNGEQSLEDFLKFIKKTQT